MPAQGPQPQLDTDDRRATERLDSWKEIAAYLSREERTVQRWEKSLGLPVRRLAGQQKVFAYKSEIDAWWHERETKIQEEEANPPATQVEPSSAVIHPSEQTPEKQLPQRTFLRHAAQLVGVKGAAFILAVIVLLLAWPRIQQRIWPHPGKALLAVMPFKNLSADPDAQRVAEGLTEETISRLGRLHPNILGVIELPPSSASRGFDPSGNTAKIDYLLEGSVRHAGGKVAITAQLVLLKDQTRIWGDSYERDLRNPEDIIPIEIEVADALTNQALSKLPHDNSPPKLLNPDAYEAYLKGRFFWNKRTAESLTKAVAYFQQAIQFDPNYAPSYAGLADCYSLLGSAPYTALPPIEAFPKSEAAARKALELDPSLAEAHVSLGYSELVYDRDFANAEREFQQAIQLRPAYATAHQYYAYYLTSMGRLPETIKERQIAHDLDPLSPLILSALGEAYYQARQFDRTIEQNQKSLELDPSYAISLINLGRAYEQKGKYDLALGAFQKILTVAPDDPGVLALVGHGYAVSGRRAEALRTLSKLHQTSAHRYVPALYFAVIYTGLRDKEKAFEWLDNAFEERCEYLVYLPTEPMADPLRSDPRFSRLLRRLGLESAKLSAENTGQ